jgi:hypothetical protein
LQERFAGVFDLTYTRFLDLQKAEAQTREALIEGALERVRARALAMQQPEELKDVAQVLRNEMGALELKNWKPAVFIFMAIVQIMWNAGMPCRILNIQKRKWYRDHFVLNLDDTWVEEK